MGGQRRHHPLRTDRWCRCVCCNRACAIECMQPKVCDRAMWLRGWVGSGRPQLALSPARGAHYTVRVRVRVLHSTHLRVLHRRRDDRHVQRAHGVRGPRVRAGLQVRQQLPHGVPLGAALVQALQVGEVVHRHAEQPLVGLVLLGPRAHGGDGGHDLYVASATLLSHPFVVLSTLPMNRTVCVRRQTCLPSDGALSSTVAKTKELKKRYRAEEGRIITSVLV